MLAENIAKALQALTEISYVRPYTDERPVYIEDFEKIIQTRLDKIHYHILL
jgi:hypothetical protein